MAIQTLFGSVPQEPTLLEKLKVGIEKTRSGLVDRIEEATNEIINIQLERACEIVSRDRESIDRLVAMLMERDTLDADEIRQCFDVDSVLAA